MYSLAARRHDLKGRAPYRQFAAGLRQLRRRRYRPVPEAHPTLENSVLRHAVNVRRGRVHPEIKQVDPHGWLQDFECMADIGLDDEDLMCRY